MKINKSIIGLFLILFSVPVFSQQYIINDRDRTRPEMDRMLPMMKTSSPVASYDNLSRPHYTNYNLPVSGVELYPTIVRNGTVNLKAYYPIERISVINTNGEQVYAYDAGGKMEQLSIVLPSLSSGVYYMIVYGRNWTETKKFIWKDIKN